MTAECELTTVNKTISDYVVNEKSKKFHFPDCYSVSIMAEENKIYYNGNREELTEQGYEPCKKCRNANECISCYTFNVISLLHSTEIATQLACIYLKSKRFKCITRCTLP